MLYFDDVVVLKNEDKWEESVVPSIDGLREQPYSYEVEAIELRSMKEQILSVGSIVSLLMLKVVLSLDEICNVFELLSVGEKLNRIMWAIDNRIQLGKRTFNCVFMQNRGIWQKLIVISLFLSGY